MVENETGSKRPSGMALVVSALYLVLAYCYVFTVQPKYGPDEPRHFAYVRRLVEKHELPVLRDGREEDGAHTLHPPLYYTLMAPIYAASSGGGERSAYLAIKCMSPLLLLGALWFYWLALRRLFPESGFARDFAFAFVALLPLYQLEASVVNNDVLAVLMGSLLIWLLVRDWERPPCLRSAVIVGLAMAAFVNTKATGWTLAPLWALALHLRSRANPEWRKGLLRDLVAGYAMLALLGTWWYVRNEQLYGQLVPFDFGQNDSLRPFNLRTGDPLSPIEVYTSGYIFHWGWRAAEGLYQSFWSQIDWIAEDYRLPIWWTMLILVLAALVGAIKSAIPRLMQWSETQKRQKPGSAPEHSVGNPPPVSSPLWVPGSAFTLNWLHTWFIATFMHQGFYQGGRYLMPSVFGAGALMASGLSALVPKRAQAPMVILLIAALVALNAHCLIELATVLNPKYVRP